MDRRQALDVSALCFFVTSTVALSARFSSSAAFERPIHFSILTLLLSGGLLSAVAWWNRADRPPALRLAPASVPAPFRTSPNNAAVAGARAALDIVLRLRLLPAPFALLVACLTGRVILFWRVIRTIQCSWDGLHAFLPLLLAVAEAASRWGGRRNGLPKPGVSGYPVRPYVRYIAFAGAWGCSATAAFRSPGMAAGAICPSGWRWEPLIPVAQILVLVLDMIILMCLSRVWREHEAIGPTSAFMSSSFLFSSVLLSLLALASFYNSTNIVWAIRIHSSGVRSLILDTLLASTALLCGVFLLSSVHPSTIAVTIGALGLFVRQCARMMEPTAGLDASDSWWVGILAALCVGALLNFGRDLPAAARPAGETLYHHAFMVLYWVLLAAFLVLYIAEDPQPDVMASGRHAITNLMESLRGGSESWISRAGRSATLEEAVVEYRRRYGIPPPPRFDRWYEFATSRNSSIIDSFDQINSDLRPFWGLQPSVIRERTAHLLEYPHLSMGGLRIQGGNVELSPHTPGTHAWMMEANAAMIRPFARWLPDMDLAFNLNDECRMAVPFRDMRSLNAAARQSRSRLARVDPTGLAGFDGRGGGSSGWSGRFLERDGARDEKTASPYFADNTRRQIFYDVIAPTCPPGAPAQTSVWWNRKIICSACTTGHAITTSTVRLVSDWMAAADLCHQPDMAYLHGFLMSPAPMISTDELFPILSQSRTGGFADILVPSPWNFYGKTTYDDADDVPWEEKVNALFWRGTPSDGYAAHGSWEGFLRTRFVHAAQKLSSSDGGPAWPDGPERLGFSVNVSFVGEFGKCHERDCSSETDTFYRHNTARDRLGSGDPPPHLPFTEHWRFRHLIDLDGAGFSGRFLPFLQSRSLVYRAALFRTWFDERVHAWRHYVPLDVRLGKGLWGVVGFFAGGRGERLGRQIAEDGRDWARKVLRPEDMQVYMFRLLLEWGRIVNDAREEIGFGGTR